MHQETADALGLSRDDGKTLNFATLYPAGAPRIANQLGCTEREARRVLNRWFDRYREVWPLRSKLWRLVERQGHVESISSRHHYFPTQTQSHAAQPPRERAIRRSVQTGAGRAGRPADGAPCP